MGSRQWLRRLDDDQLQHRLVEELVDAWTTNDLEEAAFHDGHARRYLEEYVRRHRRARPVGCVCWDCCAKFPVVPLPQDVAEGG